MARVYLATQEDLDALSAEVGELASDVFNHYYNLDTVNTEFLSDGSIVAVSSEATITTTFATDDNGVKTITETIVPTEGEYQYIKTTIITPATSTTNKTIAEAYSRETKS